MCSRILLCLYVSKFPCNSGNKNGVLMNLKHFIDMASLSFVYQNRQDIVCNSQYPKC